MILEVGKLQNPHQNPCDAIQKDDSTQNVEHTDTIVNLSHYFKEQKDYMFPPHFNGLGFKKILIMALKMASIKSGFILSTKSSKSMKEMAKAGTFGSYTTLCCQQLRVYEKPIGGISEGPRKRYTKRYMSKDDCCVFVLHLKMNSFYFQAGGRWGQSNPE